MSLRAALLALGVTALFTGLLPTLGIAMLAPSLAESPLARRENFRQRTLFIGLGLTWVFWVAGMIVLRGLAPAAPTALGIFAEIGAISPLVITALLFGLIDDAYGTGTDRGFRGHLRALTRGRLSTGGFKLLGIGLVSLAAGASVAPPATPLAEMVAAPGAELATALAWTIALGALIALSANLINLTDLRPGRALKCYSLYGVALVIGALVTRSAFDAALLLLALGGPVVATWRYDLGERGMLGDAGANAAGAALGFIAAWECGRSWAALVVLAVLLMLNLASERWSFSKVIAGNRVLSYLDGLGREASEAAETPDSVKTSPQSETLDG